MVGEDRDDFYLWYYVGHKGKFSHEFPEFEFRPDGKLWYTNNSNYKNDTMIHKEVFLNPAVLRECQCIIADSETGEQYYINWMTMRVKEDPRSATKVPIYWDKASFSYDREDLLGVLQERPN